MAKHLARLPRTLGKPPARIPGRAQKIIELMVFGAGDGPMNYAEVAAHLKLKKASVARYMRMPAARAAYRDLVRAVREGELGKNTAAAVAIRDQPDLKDSAAGARAILESLRFLENSDRDDRAAQTFNISGGGLVMINPGYIVDVSAGGSREQMREGLKRAGSTASVFDQDDLIELNPSNDGVENADTEQ